MDALRSIAQPITRNLPGPIRDLGLNLIGPTCYKRLILDIEPFEYPDCLKLAISKAAGIGIVGASSIVKIPQLLKLVNSQSASGVSFLSYLLETSSYIITLAYNARQKNPFSTYGESALIAVQNVVISALVLQYSGKSASAAVFVAGLAAVLYALFNEQLVDARMMAGLQAGAGALGVASKLPQIITIFREGGTGQLSAFAVFNFLIGSATRIFTTLQEVNDPLILYGFIAGFILNAVLAAQMVYYWNAPVTKQAPAAQFKMQSSSQTPIANSSGNDAISKSKGTGTRRKA